MANFTGNSIQSTYQRVLQVDTGSIQDGLGNTVNIPVTQVTGATLVSSSVQIAGDISGSFNLVSSSITTRISSLEVADSAYALTSSISGAFDITSASLASRVSASEASILSLDSTYATDVQVTNAVSALNIATSSYARTNAINQFTAGQKITGSLIVSGANSTLFGSLNLFNPAAPSNLATQTIYIDSQDGSQQVFSGLQIVDQNGFDAKLEVNSYTSLDGTNPVFRLMGGGTGSKQNNAILTAFKDGTVHLNKGLDAKDSVTISGSLLVTSSFGNNITFIGNIQQGTPAQTLPNNTISLYVDTTGSNQVYSSLQIIDQEGPDAKLEVNSYTGLDGTNPVFRLMGGGNGSNSDNTIIRSFNDGRVEIPKTLIISSSQFIELQPSAVLPASANTGSLAVTGSTLAFYDGNNWKTVVTGSTLPL